MSVRGGRHPRWENSRVFPFSSPPIEVPLLKAEPPLPLPLSDIEKFRPEIFFFLGGEERGQHSLGSASPFSLFQRRLSSISLWSASPSSRSSATKGGYS